MVPGWILHRCRRSPHPNADDHTQPYEDTITNSYSHPIEDTDSNRYINSNADTDTYANRIQYTNPNPNTIRDSQTRDSLPQCDPHTDKYQEANSDTDHPLTNDHALAYSNAHYAQSDHYTLAYSNAHYAQSDHHALAYSNENTYLSSLIGG